MKVLFLPEIRQYFQELVDILFEKEYFGFEDSAVNYVRDLFFDIENSLPLRPKRKAPSIFNRYGKNMFYASFRKSKTTQWFVFYTKYFDSGEEIYLVLRV